MEQHRNIPRTNFNYIEFVLRNEGNKLRMLKQAKIDRVTYNM